jgi:DinB superfamily
MKYLGMLALAALMLPGFASAQDSAMIPNPITTLIKQQVVRYGQLQVAAAQAMPADKFSYRSTPETRTFGQLLLHVAQFNNNMCARISGMTAPDIKDLKDTDSKDMLVAAVKGSFDFCTTAINGLDDSTLGMSAGKMGPQNLSRGGALVILAEDWFDHYGTMAIYLRLNGILPPSAQPAAGRM